jgi:hypothetical protein
MREMGRWSIKLDGGEMLGRQVGDQVIVRPRPDVVLNKL